MNELGYGQVATGVLFRTANGDRHGDTRRRRSELPVTSAPSNYFRRWFSQPPTDRGAPMRSPPGICSIQVSSSRTNFTASSKDRPWRCGTYFWWRSSGGSVEASADPSPLALESRAGNSAPSRGCIDGRGGWNVATLFRGGWLIGTLPHSTLVRDTRLVDRRSKVCFQVCQLPARHNRKFSWRTPGKSSSGQLATIN